MDPAFANVQEGLQAWRIENKILVPVDKSALFKLHSGDSYIFLQSKKGQWDIHFWLGKDTSQDEAGIAAYKSVELDDALDGKAVQHRECQGFESVRLSLNDPDRRIYSCRTLSRPACTIWRAASPAALGMWSGTRMTPVSCISRASGPSA